MKLNKTELAFINQDKIQNPFKIFQKKEDLQVLKYFLRNTVQEESIIKKKSKLPIIPPFIYDYVNFEKNII